MPASPPNTSSHETTVSDKDIKHSFKSDISHVLSNSSVACKAGPHQSSSLCGQCCFYKLQLRATAIPGHCGFGSSADSFCDTGLLACQPVVFVLHSNLAQNLCVFTATKHTRTGRDLLGCHFHTFLPISPLVRGNTGQVNSHTSQGHEHPGAAPLHQGREFPCRQRGCDTSLQ